MKLGMHLLRRHLLLYSIFWTVLLSLLGGSLVIYEVFGNPIGKELASFWSLLANVAPVWFVFVMGIVLASRHLPIGIAHGITRRGFSAGAGVFLLATCVLFGLLNVALRILEAYKGIAVMDELNLPYPMPTFRSTLSDILLYLAFILSGWLIGLTFYRLPFWWAVAVAPFAVLPLASAMEPSLHWTLNPAVVAAAGVAAYLAGQGVAIRPRKA